MVAYPEAEVRNGIDLAGKVARKPWDGQDEDLSNDSLKMCYYNGDWHGSPNPAWFPTASYLQLQEGRFVVCEHSPDCGGNQWQMSPGAPRQCRLMTWLLSRKRDPDATYWPASRYRMQQSRQTKTKSWTAYADLRTKNNIRNGDDMLQ